MAAGDISKTALQAVLSKIDIEIKAATPEIKNTRAFNDKLHNFELLTRMVKFSNSVVNLQGDVLAFVQSYQD